MLKKKNSLAILLFVLESALMRFCLNGCPCPVTVSKSAFEQGSPVRHKHCKVIEEDWLIYVYGSGGYPTTTRETSPQWTKVVFNEKKNKNDPATFLEGRQHVMYIYK